MATLQLLMISKRLRIFVHYPQQYMPCLTLGQTAYSLGP